MPYNIEAFKRLRDDIMIEAQHGRHNQGSWGFLHRAGAVPSESIPWDDLNAKFADHSFRKLFDQATSAYTRYLPNEKRGDNAILVSCPTAACAAGWAVVGAGAKMIFDPERINQSTVYCLTKEGQIEQIELYAQAILGLTDVEAEELFRPGRTTEEVLAKIDQILGAAERGEKWDRRK